MSQNIDEVTWSEESEHCATCKHWNFYFERFHDKYGECHRYAPRPLVLNDGAWKDFDRAIDRGEETPKVVWPRTKGNEKCGDYFRVKLDDEDNK